MAQISIIADDKIVVKDGRGLGGLTLSSIPADVWAVQWNSTTSKGTVEKRDLTVTEITELGVYQACIDEYDTALAAIPTADTATTFRGERNARLEASDWTQIADNQLSDTKKAEWTAYRQALRDLPANTADPKKPTFPTMPS